MDEAKQEIENVEKELEIATDIITRAKNAAKKLMEEAESVKKEANLEAGKSIAFATSSASQQLNAAEVDAKKKIDLANIEAKKIIDKAQLATLAKNTEIASWEEEKKRIASTHNFESTIKLDIGGHSFTTTLTTLTRFPKTMLGAMFSGRHALTKNENGAHFIDRDGTHFREILNYLRNPESWNNSGFQGRQSIELKCEAEYYGLKDLMFPWVPAEPEELNSHEGYKITVTQDKNQLWYIQNHQLGQTPVIICVCGKCGFGWPRLSSLSSYNNLHRRYHEGSFGLQKFTTGRTISAVQPKNTGSCPNCPKY